MTNREKLNKFVVSRDNSALEDARYRIKNRPRLRASKRIAFQILSALRDKGWSKADLAEAMDVSTPQITKWVKGDANYTLETIVKLQEVLGIQILNDLKPPKVEVRFIKVFELVSSGNFLEWKIPNAKNDSLSLESKTTDNMYTSDITMLQKQFIAKRKIHEC